MARGRPRQFDERKALLAAAEVFSERGFDGTSIQALTEAMQMGEQSIYNAFGNKEEIFHLALDQYSAESDSNREVFFGPDASLPEIETCLSMAARFSRPCLVARTCLSQDADDPAVAGKLSRHMRGSESAFLRALENAVEKGEIECHDPVEVARYLNMTMVGITVMARSGMSKQALRQLVDVSLRVVRGNKLEPTAGS